MASSSVSGGVTDGPAMKPKNLSAISFFLSAPLRRRMGCKAAFRSMLKGSFKPVKAYPCSKFVRTGPRLSRSPFNPASPAVFAVGDVRSGSVKRVGAAIGEGAAVVAQLHTYLASARASPCGELASGPSLIILTLTKNSTRAKSFIRVGTDVAEKILSAMRKCSGGQFEPKVLRP
jgi:hypothetical protein